MGLRANLVKDFSSEYGACLDFNYDSDGFGDMLDKCKVGYNRFEDYDEIECDALLTLPKSKFWH